MREGAAGKGRRWQHRALRDCEELRGAGEVSGVPIPRALSAKQRRLDPSLLELGALGSVGAGVGMARVPGLRDASGRGQRRQGRGQEQTRGRLLLLRLAAARPSLTGQLGRPPSAPHKAEGEPRSSAEGPGLGPGRRLSSQHTLVPWEEAEPLGCAEALDGPPGPSLPLRASGCPAPGSERPSQADAAAHSQTRPRVAAATGTLWTRSD